MKHHFGPHHLVSGPIGAMPFLARKPYLTAISVIIPFQTILIGAKCRGG